MFLIVTIINFDLYNYEISYDCIMCTVEKRLVLVVLNFNIRLVYSNIIVIIEFIIIVQLINKKFSILLDIVKISGSVGFSMFI